MLKLEFEETQDTPRILLDAENRIFEITGRSLPEDCIDFYTPVFKWIAEYKKQPPSTTTFTFKLDYFNTASSKIILDILLTLKDLPGIQIRWFYSDDDEDILDAGTEFAEQVLIPFEFLK